VDELSRFKETYFDESAELIGVAEAGLLRLSPGNVDMDEVNAIFRAVHSIKGGGGAFGFTDLVHFAHEFEAVMDGVRASRVAITTELVDVMIKANDLLARLLACARDASPAPTDQSEALIGQLRRAAGFEVTDAGPAAAPLQPAGAASQGAPEAGDDGRQTFQIRFVPKDDLLTSGNEPIFMLRALRHMGDAAINVDLNHLPPLSAIEPETIYLSWTVLLTTDEGGEGINDVFEFVSDDSVVEITEIKHATGSVDPDGAWGLFDDEPEAEAAPVPAAAAPTSAPLVPATTPAMAVAKAEPVREPPPRPTGPTGGGGGGGPSAVNLGGHTIRVDLDKIDRLVNMVGEMVITQAMIAEHVRDLPPGAFQELLEGLEQLAQHTRELRESVMSIRAQPVNSVFARMPRLARELAQETGKDVVLVMSGENTEVDKTVVENLVDPLTHMIRNSIDHGLETPNDREAAGKPRTGTVHLSAQHRSGRIVIEVSDDGRGINRPRVLQKAQEKGLIPAGASLSDEEIDNLIFLPGFSTADKVSNISGRGVGMDVVRRNITNLGGRITVYSVPGEGSRFVLSLPLTLAVLDGMVISVGEERFVLPLTNIVESLRPKPADLHGLVNQCDVIMARGEYVRLVYLNHLFGIPKAIGDATKGLVVLVETEDGGRLGLVVDEVLGQQQVVIKSLEANYRRLDGVAAATILGDGRVALILDVAGLQEMSRQSSSASIRQPAPDAVPLLEAV